MNKDNHEEFLRSENKRLERELTMSKLKLSAAEAKAELKLSAAEARAELKLSAAEARAEVYHQNFFNERQEHVKTRDWNRVMFWSIIVMSIVLCILIKHNWDQHKLLEAYRDAEVIVTDTIQKKVYVLPAERTWSDVQAEIDSIYPPTK